MTSAHRKRKARSERRKHLLRNAGAQGCREASLSSPDSAEKHTVGRTNKKLEH